MRLPSREDLLDAAPWVFGVMVLAWLLAASILIFLRVAALDRTLLVQQQAIQERLTQHSALLKRVEADEHRICAAAQASGDQQIIKILCPEG